MKSRDFSKTTSTVIICAFCLSSLYNFLLHEEAHRAHVCCLLIEWRDVRVTLPPDRPLGLSLHDNNGYKTIAEEKCFEESSRRQKGTRRFVYCQNHHKYSHIRKRGAKSMAQHYRWRWGLWPRRSKKKNKKKLNIIRKEISALAVTSPAKREEINHRQCESLEENFRE